jgi:uncharacterized protein YcnI
MRWLGAFLVLAMLPTGVQAHVIVTPDQSTAGGWERYTVLVPTEKASPTVRVQVRLPMGVNVIAVEAKAGWEGQYDPLPVGAARVEWKGGRIPEGQFVAFEFLAWNPPAPRALEWQATQWYEDGTNDRWGGAGDAEHHGSTTTLKPGTGRADIHGHEQPKPATKPTH